MIAAAAELHVAWLDINDVCFGKAQECDLGKAAHYAQLMSDPAAPADAHIAPPMVSPDPDVPGRYLLRDGKHRWLAQLALGRQRIRCLIVVEKVNPAEQVDDRPTQRAPDRDEPRAALRATPNRERPKLEASGFGEFGFGPLPVLDDQPVII